MARLTRHKTLCLFLALTLVLSSGAAAQAALVDDQASPSYGVAQNVILLIGDGMGPAHRTAARYFGAGPRGSLVMDTLPVTGMARTSPADALITDSAAAATAMASGIKTYNGAIGVDTEGNPVETILELAKDAGKATGLVTNTQITHATSAAFAAHVSSRGMMTEIARQELALGVDVLLGGGEDEFLPPSETGHYPKPGEREDGRNLIGETIAAGYTYVWDKTTFDAADPGTTSKLLGLFADEGMVRPYQPSLAEMTKKAIDILSQDSEGFFLMVEGGQIDWASHGNDATNAINDTLAFDEAIAVAKEFADRDGQTLLIVTADHETGGMAILDQGEIPFNTPDGQTFYIGWATGSHSSVDIPTSAQGPHALRLTGYYENTHIYEVMVEAMLLQGTVQGTVHFQGRTNHSGTEVAVGDHNTTTISDGSFSITVPAGTYTVTASTPGYLPSERTNVVLAPRATITLPPVTLISGDFTGDGIVDLFDLVQLGINFNRSGFSAW